MNEAQRLAALESGLRRLSQRIDMLEAQLAGLSDEANATRRQMREVRADVKGLAGRLLRLARGFHGLTDGWGEGDGKNAKT